MKKENVINLYTYNYKVNSKNNEAIETYVQILSTKNLSNIILDKKNYNEIIIDIKKFKSNKEYYYKYGIPYKRCYYLYGLPGTGKTSIIKIIGKYYDLDIHSFSYNDFDYIDIINK